MAKAIALHDAAADTFGIKIAQSAFVFQLKQLFERLNMLVDQLNSFEAEIGDIHRFKSAATLVAYAGIDPSVRQSGTFNSIHNHMSKRGSPYLRHAIFLAASTCSLHESPLNAYYLKKKAQGKHHLTAVGAVSRKLTSIIYAVLRDEAPYEAVKFC